MKKRLAEVVSAVPLLILFFVACPVCGAAGWFAWRTVGPADNAFGALLVAVVPWCVLSFIFYELMSIVIGVFIAMLRELLRWPFILSARVAARFVRRVEQNDIVVRADWYTNGRLRKEVFASGDSFAGIAAVALAVTNKRLTPITISLNQTEVREPSQKVITGAVIAAKLGKLKYAFVPQGFGYTSYEMVLLPLIFPIPVPFFAWGWLRDKITLARNAFDSLTIEPSHTQRGCVYFNFDDAGFPDGLYLEISLSPYPKTRQEQLPRGEIAVPGSPVSYFPDGNSCGGDQQTIKVRVPY